MSEEKDSGRLSLTQRQGMLLSRLPNDDFNMHYVAIRGTIRSWDDARKRGIVNKLKMYQFVAR